MLVVVGDLVADLIVLGSARLERGTDNRAEVRLTRGGSAANVAAAAVGAGLDSANAVNVRHPTRFIGRIGDDTLGETLVRELEAAGVDVRVQRAGRTGSIVILVDDDGERTMITDRGAAAELEAIHEAWLEGADWIHLPLYGFVAEGSRAALFGVCGWARDRGVPVSVDLSSVAAMRELGSVALGSILATVRPAVVFANAQEAQLAAELDLFPAIEGVYVVKRGGDPVLVTAHGSTAEVGVDRAESVRDSTGAGDAFAAGYLIAALTGAAAVEAARAGAALAREALHRPGAL